MLVGTGSDGLPLWVVETSPLPNRKLFGAPRTEFPSEGPACNRLGDCPVRDCHDEALDLRSNFGF